MANDDLAIDKFLNYGLRDHNLDEILASNCVMDWFGRTFVGQQKVVSFYYNSKATHGHAISDVKTIPPFEERPYHFLTRKQPPENMTSSSNLNGDEQWFDCEALVDLKDKERTPNSKSSPLLCPPAPCRLRLKFCPSKNDLDVEDTDNDDADESSESGVYPLDDSFEVMKITEKSPVTKKPRMNKIQDQTTVEQLTHSESKYSDLNYFEATGCVNINRQQSSSDEMEKRDFKLLVSYRVHKKDSNIIQIALIVYKSNMNLKTRRNLMNEFASQSSPPKCRTTVKHREKTDATDSRTSSAPPGTKYSKGKKRPLNAVRL